MALVQFLLSRAFTGTRTRFAFRYTSLYHPCSSSSKFRMRLYSSTVFRGTSFENRCLLLLEKELGMSLQRVGGKEDGGVDLSGWWWLPDVDIPDSPQNTNEGVDRPFKRIRILGQCKAERKKIGPKYVRELEGVVGRYMALESDAAAKGTSKTPTPVIAIFLSESPFTKSAILRAMTSKAPFLLVYLPPLVGSDIENSNGTDSEERTAPLDSIQPPGSCIYNPALGGSTGLFKGEIEARWVWSSSSRPGIASETSLPTGAPALHFRGKTLRGWIPPELTDLNAEMDGHKS
ncbi:hypothetical protein BDP27DRAFT_1321575 [Rhodocollybia butyracea]|uniref:Uncharacterized protein n=1 Tax=Rhodocollybia butyracea TaxID=206335 RepID=A0A9P5PT82_9AGAR|nr:hypothetical protein BDP27DRAFT_1321575 [Rhodocollybia butyracea]